MCKKMSSSPSLETTQLSRKTNGRKHLRFRHGHRGRCTTTVQFFKSCEPRRVWWSLSCSRRLWKTERTSSDADSRMFLGELGAVAVGRPEVPASRVMGVASRSHAAHLLMFHSSLRLLCPQVLSRHHHHLALSRLDVVRGSFVEPVGDMILFLGVVGFLAVK